MLINVRSSYIAKIIFTYIDEEIKLKLIKYNKALQKKIDVNIINYKLFKGRSIIYESNGKGKEYNSNDDKLIYEGEYLNGQRNGKGWEYYQNGIIKFFGEYLKGKRNGKGKEYNIYGGLKFDGEYLNNRKIIGIEYDFKGNILYKLNSNNNKETIKEEDFNGNIIFKGEYLNGQRNGNGIEYYPNGRLKFEGEYLNGKKWEGHGYVASNDIKDIHEYSYALRNGKGLIKEYYDSSQLKFEGEYSNGQINGIGKEYNLHGEKLFEGKFVNDKKNGKGNEYYFNGKLKFEGEYHSNYRIKGKLYRDGKVEFDGDFLYDKKWNGKGYDSNGNIIYELVNGNGKAKEYNNYGGKKYEGEYLNGKRKK